MDSVVKNIIGKFETRQTQGFIKYGTTMDRGDLTKLEWLKHAQEEAMDFVVYLEKLIQIETGTEAKPEVIERKVGQVMKGDNIMSFGKYQGRPLDDVPASYFGWLLEQPGFKDKNPELAEYAESRLAPH